MINHTDSTLITDMDITIIPRHNSVSGYGRKIPTRYILKYKGTKRRVYSMIYGNSGSCYIIDKGLELFLDIDTEHNLMELS